MPLLHALVWAATIPAFLYTTIGNLHAAGLTHRSTALAALARNHTVVLTAWTLTILALIAHRFWPYWTSLI